MLVDFPPRFSAFNGKDLSGWVPVNVAPETFSVRDGLIVSTTPDPAAPSGQTPPYVKPTTKGRAKPKGAKPRHPGHRRPTPPRIDRR
ncbi:MAG: hypothetical protein ACXVA7_13850, partial [Isosphaeraceae bacterium]